MLEKMTQLVAAIKKFTITFAKKSSGLVHSNWQYLLIALFGLIATAGVWGDLGSFLMGDDVTFHITRLKGTVQALLDGQIFPQVDPSVVGGYGYAYNIFYGPLITWIAAGMRLLISSWPVVLNLICVLLLLASGFLTYKMIFKISKNKVLATLTAIIYMLTPYHLMNLYMRMALGEFVAMAALPLLMLGLYQLANQEKSAVRNIIIAATVIVLSNNVFTIMAIMMSAIYLVCNFKQVMKRTTIQKIILACLGIFGLTACFTLPLFEAKLTGSYGVFDTYYQNNFFNLGAEYLNITRIPPASLIKFQFGENFDTVANVGVDIVAAIGLIGFWFIRSKIKSRPERRFVTSVYAIALITMILTTTLISWQYMPSILHTVQFPWRLLAIFAFAASIVSGYVIFYLISELKEHQQQILLVITGLLMLLPIAKMISLQEDRHFVVSDDMYLISHGAQGWQAEYAPVELLCRDTNSETGEKDCGRFVLMEKLEKRGDNFKILSGKASVANYHKEGTHVSFHIVTSPDTEVELPLIWYAGYQAKSGRQNLIVTPSEQMGLVTVKIPANFDGNIEVRYGLSIATRIGLIISGLTLVICLACTIIPLPKVKSKIKRLIKSIKRKRHLKSKS